MTSSAIPEKVDLLPELEKRPVAGSLWKAIGLILIPALLLWAAAIEVAFKLRDWLLR